jgi:hypothetical protein
LLGSVKEPFDGRVIIPADPESAVITQPEGGGRVDVTLLGCLGEPLNPFGVALWYTPPESAAKPQVTLCYGVPLSSSAEEPLRGFTIVLWYGLPGIIIETQLALCGSVPGLGSRTTKLDLRIIRQRARSRLESNGTVAVWTIRFSPEVLT